MDEMFMRAVFALWFVMIFTFTCVCMFLTVYCAYKVVDFSLDVIDNFFEKLPKKTNARYINRILKN